MQHINTSPKRLIQVIATVSLGVILLGLVGVYIYFGMQRAKLADVRTDTVAGEDSAGTADGDTIEMARRMKILDELATESVSTSTPAEREAILLQLELESEPSTMTEAQRLEILQALQTGQEQNEP